jgi:molybdenum cofactor cytidylyltransferase
MLAAGGFTQRLIVCSSFAIGTPPGFARVDVPAGAPQSVSLKAAMAAVNGDDVDAVLLALADMPLVSSHHIAMLVERFAQGDGRPVASSSAGRALPPAIFGRNSWPALRLLTGDQGARALLENPRLVEAPSLTLSDVDTADDFNLLDEADVF